MGIFFIHNLSIMKTPAVNSAFPLKSPLLWLTAAIALALVLPVLMMDGMFMDGMMYTAVGHNMALGEGSFWYPYYLADFHNMDSFHENPPLGYFIFSIFFRLFGSSIYVERFYILLTFILTAVLIYHLWKQLFPRYKSVGWLPILLWALIPTTFWSYTHNMMENTMVLFVLLAISSIWKGLQSGRQFLWVAVAAVFTWLAFLVKGPTGLYPLAAVFIYWVVYRSFSFWRMLGLSFWLVLICAVLVAIPFIHPYTAQSMDNYFFERTLTRINKIPSVSNRFWILGHWLQQIVVPAALVLLGYFIGSKKLKNNSFEINWQAFGFLLLLGLCGVLPLLLTRVQRPFYLVTAYPLFAMALAVPISAKVQFWHARLLSKPRLARNVKMAAGLIFTATLVVTFLMAGKPKRSASTLHDIEIVADQVGQGVKISASPPVSVDYATMAYFVRLHQIEVHRFKESKTEYQYFISYNDAGEIPPGYKELELPLKRFALYVKR